MKCLIVYESGFGNTAKVARSMGDALKAHEATVAQAAQVADADLAAADLVIVGSATRGFSPMPDTAAFLKRMPDGALAGKAVAAFDTRIVYEDVANPIFRFILTTFGRYAAPQIAKTLEQKGGRRVAEPEGFIVSDTEGPMEPGEIERAGKWAAQAADAASRP